MLLKKLKGRAMKQFKDFNELTTYWIRHNVVIGNASSDMDILLILISSQPEDWIQKNRDKIVEFCNKGFSNYDDQLDYLTKCRSTLIEIKKAILELPPLKEP
jgi:hypothetical protein